MAGLDMMLKSFGLDPVQIKKTVEGIGQGVLQVNERLARIEATQNNILEMLKNGQRENSDGSERTEIERCGRTG